MFGKNIMRGLLMHKVEEAERALECTSSLGWPAALVLVALCAFMGFFIWCLVKYK